MSILLVRNIKIIVYDTFYVLYELWRINYRAYFESVIKSTKYME